jgi:prolipoprotein diacylglyceryltransferase
LKIPFEPILFGITINVHLIFEYLAFFIAFRYYIHLKKGIVDHISNSNRLSIILGCIVGAYLGSRLIAHLENPFSISNSKMIVIFLNNKSIMGGLFGGLLGVEITKKIIHEHQSSGDLFTFPIIAGIIIGRIGCFLSGIKEFTYGKTTTFFLGMDLGDGLKRHPTALYEILFLFILAFYLKSVQTKINKHQGLLFKQFMIFYFAFRFFIEFLKPNIFFVLGLSSIQWLCIICLVYYLNTIKKLVLHAY